MSKFNQQKYIQEYNKGHYKTFKVDLKINEWEELENLLKGLKMTKAEFLRDAIKQLAHKSHQKRVK